MLFWMLLILSLDVSHGLLYGCGNANCSNSCRFTLVESIPENLTYPDSDPILISTYAAHKHLISLAEESVYLSSCYWTLLGSDTDYHDYSSAEGEDIFKDLHQLCEDGKVQVKIAQNNTNADTEALAKVGAEVRTMDFERLMHGGIMHTKMWIVDGKHAYIGSGNYDWRSYTQTKETGVLVENCPSIIEDATKIFEVYWYLGQPHSEIPDQWPKNLSTSINAKSPAVVHYNNTKGQVYLSSSPPPFCPDGRTGDIDAIVTVIRSAKKFIYISVMDYLAQLVYANPQVYWPVIDDELRKAAFNSGVQVYLMASHWKHTLKDMYAFLRSLSELATTKYHKVDIQVKIFTVNATASQEKIPYSRVDHNKYMVTDQHAYIGTSNWSGDYFIYTGGVGFILEQADEDPTNLREQLKAVFLRDWNSVYAAPLYKN